MLPSALRERLCEKRALWRAYSRVNHSQQCEAGEGTDDWGDGSRDFLGREGSVAGRRVAAEALGATATTGQVAATNALDMQLDMQVASHCL